MKLQLTGERINYFENCVDNSVKMFNNVFKDFPIDLPENTEIEIGEIVKVNCYEIKNIAENTSFLHYFERRKLDESIMPDDFDDDDY